MEKTLWIAFGLGAFHGLNPAMGWLFSVCLALQKGDARAIVFSLFPISLGHALSTGVMALLFGALGLLLSPFWLKVLASSLLIVFGVWRLLRNRHPRWVGMQVGFFDLVAWSFLVATAHGAGLILWPLYWCKEASFAFATSIASGLVFPASVWLSMLPLLFAHIAGHFWTSGLAAWIVYDTWGGELLRKAWFNVDLGWAVALVVTGAVFLLD
ncbi:hypothetical protein [Candidatus Methylacidithermus pantelleriae]|uniref:Uncharacterized protein n=1 Tax=Candidatus Methylacidithermus pantelleriae TaxID=2744239 RepID=A0A8J2FNT6_9BACT|nr:hypothetical protein [Candidatus Methylacidithermus pantelleriae]CAF0695027.1 conserved membrane hypothetical protein [Candidatus Methylacidithermus pantelleriae]